jgi:hypothetical protein
MWTAVINNTKERASIQGYMYNITMDGRCLGVVTSKRNLHSSPDWENLLLELTPYHNLAAVLHSAGHEPGAKVDFQRDELGSFSIILHLGTRRPTFSITFTPVDNGLLKSALELSWLESLAIRCDEIKPCAACLVAKYGSAIACALTLPGSELVSEDRIEELSSKLQGPAATDLAFTVFTSQPGVTSTELLDVLEDALIN